MSDEEVKAHAEMATRNSREAVRMSEATRDQLIDRIQHLEQIVAAMGVKVGQLEQRYNLLLTARFDGRATS